MSDPLAALRAKFLERAADDLAWIEATGGAPAEKLLARVHRLAGAGGVFGHPDISEAASAVEDALREGRTPGLTPLTSALRAALT